MRKKATRTAKTTATRAKKASTRSSGAAGVRILLATDGSPGAAVALDLVAALPLRSRDEVIVVMYPDYFLAARPDRTGLIGRLMQGRRDAALRTVDAAVRQLEQRGLRASGVVAEGLEAVDGILRVIAERAPDLLVMGTRGLGPVRSAVIGSVARALAQLSPVPVLIVRDLRTAPQRVLVAVDGSEASRAALSALARLPAPKELTIEILNVMPARDWARMSLPDEHLGQVRETQERAEAEAADALLRSSREALPTGVRVRTAKERGAVTETIWAHADAMAADLIVLGSRGDAGPRRPFWGSTAERLIVTSGRSVLVAPPPAKRPSRSAATARAGTGRSSAASGSHGSRRRRRTSAR
ncbi:MAG TPA: universal stress protein [Candidatus Limnocylindria bacterium]|nr:universal stress protein [Candidatus Limnocylindria bacterium]